GAAPARNRARPHPRAVPPPADPVIRAVPVPDPPPIGSVPAGPTDLASSAGSRHVPARAGAAMSSSTPAPSSVTIRPWRDGDDRALAQVLPDPSSPAQLAARALLREPGASPLTRTVIATVGGVVVGAAAIAESPAHPTRAWVHVEVAPGERRA